MDATLQSAMGDRLQKILSRHGVTSRREAERLIREGRITVNGKVVKLLGDRADPDSDVILVDGSPLPIRRAPQVIMLHKPVGFLCTNRKDREKGATVFDLVSSDRRLFTIGRLDRDTSGLLLLTDDGDLALRLTHPRYGTEKTYLVETKSSPQPGDLDRLRKGIQLDDGPARAIRAEQVGKRKIRLVVTEGRNRLVRRMIVALNLKVTSLKRTQIGKLTLGSLAPGEFRILSKQRVQMLDDGQDQLAIEKRGRE